MAIGLEDERVSLEEAREFPAAGEAELAVELSGVVEAENAVGLLGEELLGAEEEAEGGVAVEDAFEGGDSVGLGLDKLGSGALLFLALLLQLFGGFGDEEGSGEMGSEYGVVWVGIGIGVLERGRG